MIRGEVTMVLCPGCGLEQDGDSACERCAAPLRIGDIVLDRALPSDIAELDAAGALYLGHDVGTGARRLVRVARPGEDGRLRRETTVLSGLGGMAKVPDVIMRRKLDGVGEVLVMTAPTHELLSDAVARGLRTDARGARGFLRGGLAALASLEALSPPVHHRNINPRTVWWDGGSGVGLIDFCRATDVAADISSDLVVAAIGYAPAAPTTTSARDLFGLAATAVHLLSRRSPAELMRGGRLAFRDEVRIDDALADFLDGLLTGVYRSAAEAQLALERIDKVGSLRTPMIAAALACVLVVVAGAAVMLSARAEAPSPATPPARSAITRAAVTVTTSPPGALVRDGDRPLGTTPVTTTATLGQPLNLVVLRDGFASVRKRLFVERDLNLALQMAPARARPVRPSARTPAAKQIEAGVEHARVQLEACDPHGIERVKYHLVVDDEGALTGLRPLGSGSTAASRCVEAALRQHARFTPGAANADVWVWLQPNLVLRVY